MLIINTVTITASTNQSGSRLALYALGAAAAGTALWYGIKYLTRPKILSQAIGQGDLEAVKDFLNDGASIDTRRCGDLTALHFAAALNKAKTGVSHFKNRL